MTYRVSVQIDGERYTYLDLAAFLEDAGQDPDRDLPELWKRALFSCAIGNVGNHLRNHGFLHSRSGWALSPAFDVNPTPGGGEKYLAMHPRWMAAGCSE